MEVQICHFAMMAHITASCTSSSGHLFMAHKHFFIHILHLIQQPVYQTGICNANSNQILYIFLVFGTKNKSSEYPRYFSRSR